MVPILDILAPLADRINNCMAELLAKDEEVVSRVGTFSFEGGGKRLRPMIFCLISEALGSILTPNRIETSTAFEFLHMATLLHDDIVDEAETRRGRPAAHLVFGPAEAVLAGDYLLAKAAGLCAEEDNLDCVKLMAWVVRTMSLGELIQLGARHRADLPEEEYFRIIFSKTAVLMEGAAKSAAFLAGVDQALLQASAQYGQKLGLAFQIMDDILDYQSDQATFGKPVGHDLDEGKITLPYIRAKKALGETNSKRLGELAEQGKLSTSQRDEIVGLVRQGGGVESALATAELLAQQAVESLNLFKPSLARDHLKQLALFTVERQN